MIFLGNSSRGTFEEPRAKNKDRLVSSFGSRRGGMVSKVYLRFLHDFVGCKFLRREFYPRGNVESNYSFYFFFSALVELIEKNWGGTGEGNAALN